LVIAIVVLLIPGKYVNLDIALHAIKIEKRRREEEVNKLY
jgi:hypothetical protein